MILEHDARFPRGWRAPCCFRWENKRQALRAWIAACAAFVLTATGPSVIAATFTVNDEAALRAALSSATDGDEVLLGSDITLSSDLPPIQTSIAFKGSGRTLNGARSHRGVFVLTGTVSIESLTIADTLAKGGNGGGNGGAGMGAGGALFVNTGANVTLKNVLFSGNAARGGSATDRGLDGGGGGGMAGDGGYGMDPVVPPQGGLGGGGGGGGITASGARAGGGVGAGAAASVNGGNGGDATQTFGGGGGGAGVGTGGNGRDFGGGGGAGRNCGARAGVGGFGGGGGGGGCSPTTLGGSGGYGAGGGGAWGTGGFAGGAGGRSGATGTSGGGGGAGLGGSAFVREGGTLAILGASDVHGGSVVAGTGASGVLGGPSGTNGRAWGSGFFLQGSGGIRFAPVAGSVQTMADVIADEKGVQSYGGSYSVQIEGDGKVVFSGANQYAGRTTISSGVLELAAPPTGSATGTGEVLVDGGSLVGLGVVSGSTVLASGVVAPGSVSNPQGGLQVGDYRQTGGTLKIASDAKLSSTLTVTRTAQLGGSLQVDFAAPPRPGQKFTILMAPRISGLFGSMQFNGLAAGTSAAVDYLSGSVVVSISTITHDIGLKVDPAGSGTLVCSPNPVPHGQASTCQATSAPGFVFASFSGDCSGTSCAFENVQSGKTVSASFVPVYAITALAEPTEGGTVSCTPNPVSHGSTVTCTATPRPGHMLRQWSGDCSGTTATCTLNHVTGAKSVSAQFAVVQTSFTGTTVPARGQPSGTATASFTGGGANCRFDATATAFTAAPASQSPGQTLPHGMLAFKLIGCDATPVNMSIVWPANVQGVTKWGKAKAGDASSSYFAPDGAATSGKTTRFALQDGALGDDDWTVNGEIIDPVAATVPSSPATPVPVSAGWLLVLLTSLMTGATAMLRRRRRAPG